jgi:hypothetical protein
MAAETNRPASLRFPDTGSPGEGLTAGLAKGVCAFDGVSDLSEEGMGFGVPVVVSRLRTYLSYSVSTTEISNDGSTIKKVWQMDAVQNIGGRRSEGVWPYLWVETKGLVYRNLPWAQRWLLNKRATGNLTPKIGFVPAASLAAVPVEYRLTDSGLDVSVDLKSLNNLPGRSRVFILNEQGGRSFPIYRENKRAFATEHSGGWQRISAASAGFANTDGRHWFDIDARPDVAMFRGREVMEGKLSWSGIEFQIDRYPAERFSYQVDLSESFNGVGRLA